MIPLGAVLADRYQLVRFVARGGMGEVYEAHDQALDKRIALKTLTSCANQEEQLQQLRAEVELAHRVTHKYVCRTFDLGIHRHDSGERTPFITMELIVGRSLSERIRSQGSIPVAEAGRIGLFILEGLEAAHESGVLHRDLKSDNVMLRDDRGEEPFPVLMDFGLSKSLTANSTSANDGQTLAGTLAYMAPEQLQGRKPRVATDLYAFGTVMFEMLAGRLPFQASTPALQALRRLQEAAPSVRDYCEVSPRLAQFVASCLAQDPLTRPVSAREARAELLNVPELAQGSASARRLSRETIVAASHLSAAGAPTIRIVETLEERSSTSGEVSGAVVTANANHVVGLAVEEMAPSGPRRSQHHPSEDITGPPTIVVVESPGRSLGSAEGERGGSSTRRDRAKSFAFPGLGAVVLIAATAAIVASMQRTSHPARTGPPSRATYAAATLPGAPAPALTVEPSSSAAGREEGAVPQIHPKPAETAARASLDAPSLARPPTVGSLPSARQVSTPPNALPSNTTPSKTTPSQTTPFTPRGPTKPGSSSQPERATIAATHELSAPVAPVASALASTSRANPGALADSEPFPSRANPPSPIHQPVAPSGVSSQQPPTRSCPRGMICPK